MIESAFHEYYEGLHRYAYTIVRDSDRAKDIVQQVFLTVCNKKDTVQVHISLKHYLFKAVYNASINAVNRDIRHAPLEDYHFAEKADKTSIQAETRQLRQKITQSVEKLSPQCKAVFLMNREEGKTYAQISKELNISIKTVEAHMTKALKTLKEELSDLIYV